VQQRGEEDADVAIRAPPSPPGDAHCHVGFLFVGNGSRPAAARDAGGGEGCGCRRAGSRWGRGVLVRGEHEREERGERKTTGGAYPVEGKGKDAHTEIQNLQVGPYTRQIRASRRIGQDSGFVRIVMANIQYREL